MGSGARGVGGTGFILLILMCAAPASMTARAVSGGGGGPFVLQGDNRNLFAGCFAFDGVTIAADDDVSVAQLAVPYAEALLVNQAVGSDAAQSQASQVSTFGDRLIVGRGHVQGHTTLVSPDAAGDHNSLSFLDAFVQVSSPTMVAAHMKVDVSAGTRDAFSSSILSFKTIGAGRFQVFDISIESGPGERSFSVNELYFGRLMPGTYQLHGAAEVNGSGPAEAAFDFELSQACSVSTLQFQLPPPGVAVNLMFDVFGRKSARTAHATGSISATVLRDCADAIIGLRIDGVDLHVVEPSLSWSIPRIGSATVSGIAIIASAAAGSLGPMAQVDNGCCGRLLGCVARITGDADYTIGRTMMARRFDEPVNLFGGVPFDLTAPPVAGGVGALQLAMPLELFFNFDLGLGKMNPTLAVTGDLLADGQSCAASDLNCDGVINSTDLGILLSSWSIPAGAPGCGGDTFPCPADANFDGVVNSLDLGILLSSWTL